MYLYEFNDDLGCNVRVESDNIPAQLPENCYLSETLYQPDEIKATEIIGGVVQGIEGVSGPEELFLHAAITAPGSGPTGVPSVAADETATITADIRTGEDSLSDLWAYTGTLRVPYRKNQAYHGEMRMEFTSGQCVYTFSPLSHHHGTLSIDETDFGLLGSYRVRVVGNPKLIVDEVSAA